MSIRQAEANLINQITEAIDEVGLDTEFDHASTPGVLVRCGWKGGVFMEVLNGKARSVFSDEYNAMVKEACRRCEKPHSDNITKHYAQILLDWSE